MGCRMGQRKALSKDVGSTHRNLEAARRVKDVLVWLGCEGNRNRAHRMHKCICIQELAQEL